jgi:hypothetical protein
VTLSPAEGSKTSALRGSWAIIQCGYKSSLHATGGPTNTHSTNVYIIKLVMHVSHRLREAKKDKKVPPFLFFVIYFWQRNSWQQRSSLDVTDDGNRRQPMEGPSAYSVKIMWRWSLKFISVIIIYYMYVKEFDRSVGGSRRQQNGRGKPQK